MPLLVGANVPKPFVNDLAASFNDVPRATWIAPDGTSWPLSDTTNSWFTLRGVKGLGASPVTFTADPVWRGGTAMRHVQAEPRLITWPLFIEGATHADFIANWRALGNAFAQTRRLGPGTLVVTRPDGTSRQIKAYYQDGFDNGSADSPGTRWDTVAVTLYCPDPYWTATTLRTVTRYHSASGLDYLAPYPTVANAQILGGSVAHNAGDVEVWPTWTITGPATSIVATHSDLGQNWQIDVLAYRGSALQLGQTITITTDPPAVVGPDGSSWAGALNWPNAWLWPLNPGDNNISMTLAGEDTGTSVQMTFYNRYETA